MIIWGGNDNTGGRYNPATDTWTPTSTLNAPRATRTTDVPTARFGHTAVWTGSEMIIWGGNDNTGGRYNPATDTWTPTSTLNAPRGRARHTAVWTGSEMIVRGGASPDTNTGGRYDPNTDTWSSTNVTNAPSLSRWGLDR